MNESEIRGHCRDLLDNIKEMNPPRAMHDYTNDLEDLLSVILERLDKLEKKK